MSDTKTGQGEYRHGLRKEIEIDITESGCWNCVSHKSKNGYPYIKRQGREQAIHRYVYERFVEPISGGLFVRHTCDNTTCINPDHLVVGTHQDNMDDRSRRGRTRKSAEGRARAKIDAAKALCEIYFKIAADAIGEDAVRQKRDDLISQARSGKGA